mmetsp:Transcript_12167/g.18028  ORF Transcript_12167/g.18028 Transcript_12167/m.18028 type:complete len:227 (+) Transcript_12167:2074-2754(+)
MMKTHAHPKESSVQHCGESHIIDGDFLMVGGAKGHIIERMDGFLLQLYNAFTWKMIPNCTGRYTCKNHKIVSVMEPIEMLHQSGITAAKMFSFSSSSFQREKLTTPKAASFLQHKEQPKKKESVDNGRDEDDDRSCCWKQWEFSLPGRQDCVLVIPLDEMNQTGVITYVKIENNVDSAKQKESETETAETGMAISKKYVHTLNTPSGFRRKLEAIGITVTDTNIFQ